MIRFRSLSTQAGDAHFLKLLMMSSSEGPVFLLDSLSRDACTYQATYDLLALASGHLACLLL